MIGRPRPKPGYLLVRMMPDPKPSSGLILPPTSVRSVNPFAEGMVVSVGSPTEHYPMNEFVRGGQERVLVPRGIGTVIEWDGNQHRFIHVSDVVGVINTREYIELPKHNGEGEEHNDTDDGNDTV